MTEGSMNSEPFNDGTGQPPRTILQPHASLSAFVILSLEFGVQPSLIRKQADALVRKHAEAPVRKLSVSLLDTYELINQVCLASTLPTLYAPLLPPWRCLNFRSLHRCVRRSHARVAGCYC